MERSGQEPPARRILTMNRKGEMGVGTLIIFIALLLVAAVAAGVLIQTAGSLQQRALSTGTQATGQISTNAIVLEVSAVDGQDQDIENFSIIMKLAPGSDAIKLDDTTLTLNTVETTTTYLYSNVTTPTVNATNNNGTFAVTYLQTGSNHQPGVMVRGDVIRIDLIAQSSIGEGEYVRLNFIPKIGTSTRIIFDTPDVISTERVYLYP
jgi:archaeal flagellin FlaB